MRFAVGYQQRPEGEESFVDLVADYRESVAEVYFPWVGAASGRAALGRRRGLIDFDAQGLLEEDLRRLRELGVGLDILFNANCYGERAVSEELENEVGSILQRLEEIVGGADVVTTASPFVARTVKTHFPHIPVRASVNMRIGEVEAMGYVADLFDSFYLQRDRQRDFAYVCGVRRWCEDHGKTLCLLANSGCLRNCPGQSFHDNMVAHDAGIDERKNVPGWTPHVCWRLYRERANWPAFLRGSWIRPEDVHHYAEACTLMKLATRMHAKPRMVLHAYATGQFAGNLADLLEPGFGPAFAPWVIDNTRFPADWFERTSVPGGEPGDPAYYAETLDHVLVEAG